MSCQNWNEDWVAHLYGELDADETARLERHLEDCAECSETLDRSRRIEPHVTGGRSRDSGDSALERGRTAGNVAAGLGLRGRPGLRVDSVFPRAGGSPAIGLDAE